MSDLLDELVLAARGDDPQPIPQLPLRVLAEWFYADGTARNLSAQTVEFYRNKLIYLTDAAGDRFPREITTAHLRLLLTHLREKRDWSVGTTNHFLTALKVFFSFLVKEGMLTENPAVRIPALKGDQHLPDPLSKVELQRLLAALLPGFCGLRDRAMLLICLDTGIRLGELMGLEPEDVDVEMGQLCIRRSKCRRERLVPFCGITRRVLLRYLALRGARAVTQTLWITETGTPLSRWYVMKRFERLARHAGVNGFHFHRLRHTMATEFLRNCGNLLLLQRILGHTTTRMTGRYVHLTDADTRASHVTASPVERWQLDPGERWSRQSRKEP